MTLSPKSIISAGEHIRDVPADPGSYSVPTEELAQLRARAAATVARARELIEEIRAARADRAALSVEKAIEREEMRFRRLARGKVDRFP